MLKAESDLSRQLTIAGDLWKLVKDPIFLVCLDRMRRCRNPRIKLAHLPKILWLGDERAIEYLIDFLADADKQVRFQALKMLNELEFERPFWGPLRDLPSQAESYRERWRDQEFRALMTGRLLNRS